MGNKKLEPQGNEPEESSYRIITYASKEVPKDFINLIRAPFLNTLRYGNEFFKLIVQDSYYKKYGAYVDFLINRPEMKVVTAQLNDQTVLGWALIEKNTLHYIWVKKELRRQGIGKSLIKDVNTFSHITNVGLSIWGKENYKDMVFDPFL